jgi:hypothetical protein
MVMMVMMMGWIDGFISFLYHIIPLEDVTYWKYTYCILFSQGYAIDPIRGLEQSITIGRMIRLIVLSRVMKTLLWKRLRLGLLTRGREVRAFTMRGKTNSR